MTTPLGTATSPDPFTVLGPVSISPTSAALFPGGTQQFTATVVGNATPRVQWTVNGIVGGSATVGTITPDGLYTAPSAVPSPQTVTVTATNEDDRAFTASASVVIVAPPDKILARPVSLGVAAPTTIAVNSLTALLVSVGIAPASSITVNALTAAPVSVEFETSAGQAAFLAAAPVAVALEPAITAVSPSTASPGVAGLSVLLMGAGFTGATSVSSQANGANDANLSVTDLTVSPDGREAMVSLTIASGAAPGPRVVRITTPAGTSTAAGTGGNLFTVQ